MIKAERNQVYSAHAELEEATERYIAALAKFQKTFDPQQTGLNELAEQLYDVMNDIGEELDQVL